MEHNRENLLLLIRSGLEQHKLSIAALEREAGVAKDTIRDFLRGKTQVLRADKLQKILRILSPAEEVRISGQVGKNAEITPVTQESSEKLACPPGFSATDIGAVRITGDFLLPVFHNGWIIYYSNKTCNDSSPSEGWHVPYNKPVHGEPLSDFIGKPAVIKLRDGKMYLRTLKPGSKTGRYHLTSHNSTDIQDAEIDWAAKIVFIRT